MNNAGVTIEFPEADVNNFSKQLLRAQRELGKDFGEAIRWGAWSVARSCGAATRVAPKKRPMTAVRGKVSKSGKQAYEVETYKASGHKGQRHTFLIYHRSKREANADRRVKIGMRGLAKSSWYWGIKELGSAGGTGGATEHAKKRGRENVVVEKHLKGDDPYVRITNKLPYITDALDGGLSSIEGAMGKAARHLEREITRKMDEKFLKSIGVK